ncbi:Aldose 1-epimerase [Candidatus Rhodobacter oscarellae]|uniref:Aldose 1-epimerase n=1 Tax=Candidatus Rhodobacter oscarellae TaxID=1675527 RepID=A0A0J9GS48_9RHOB|nr:aldose epimerase family protein [Candidatus Rhodobacter lobularis]KMW56303.1 Aldose 1-epimerase [Candidatus Rhodobacter lobularis]
MIEVFGTTKTGQPVHRLGLDNGTLRISLLTLGAGLHSVRLAGVPHDLTVGRDNLAPYEGKLFHLGTIMGPVANRMSNARAEIAGRRHQFDRNFLGAHTLHGGSAAVHAKLWEVTDHTKTSATLCVKLPDGEGGFPGHRDIQASFALEDNALTLTLTARTDAPTILNLANHSYWNLGPEPTTRGHLLQVHADRYLPAGDANIPTGEIAPVAGTRFDYRQPRAIEAGDEGLLDNNLCLSDARQPLRDVATLTGPTGVEMTMATTEPGLQIFDGHILDYAGLALEAQFWPDAPHNPAFPRIETHPGETWVQRTRWRFTG